MSKPRGEVEILPPNPRSSVPARVPLAPASLPARLSAGDLWDRPFIRYNARSRAMTYGAMGAAIRAEAEATQASADRIRAATDRAIAIAEYDDLPNRLAQEQNLRQLARLQEIRGLEQEIALKEIDHQVQVTRKSAELMQAATDLTLARANCTAARQRLADATQAWAAQLEYGDKYYALMWERKINEETLFVEEQRTVLQEHRQRAALADNTHARFSDIPIDIGEVGGNSAGEDKLMRFQRPR